MTPAMAWEWNIAIFCMNEAKTIATCINSVADAIGERSALAFLGVASFVVTLGLAAWDVRIRRALPLQPATD